MGNVFSVVAYRFASARATFFSSFFSASKMPDYEIKEDIWSGH